MALNHLREVTHNGRSN